jgi:hypothetical protein
VNAPTGAATTEPDSKGVALQETDSEREKVEQQPAVRRKTRMLEAKSEARSDVTPGAGPEVRSESGASWAAYALGGAGLVGVSGAALFTYWGRNDNMTLRSSCAPDCNPASVHHVRMIYLAADVSGAAGVAALLASTWLFLHPNGSDEHPSKETARLRTLDVRTSASGAVASIGGTF